MSKKALICPIAMISRLITRTVLVSATAVWSVYGKFDQNRSLPSKKTRSNQMSPFRYASVYGPCRKRWNVKFYRKMKRIYVPNDQRTISGLHKRYRKRKVVARTDTILNRSHNAQITKQNVILNRQGRNSARSEGVHTVCYSQIFQFSVGCGSLKYFTSRLLSHGPDFHVRPTTFSPIHKILETLATPTRRRQSSNTLTKCGRSYTIIPKSNRGLRFRCRYGILSQRIISGNSGPRDRMEILVVDTISGPILLKQ